MLYAMVRTGQSLIADYYPDSSRGKAFGGLFLTGAIGGMLGSLYATNLGAHTIRFVCAEADTDEPYGS